MEGAYASLEVYKEDPKVQEGLFNNSSVLPPRDITTAAFGIQVCSVLHPTGVFPDSGVKNNGIARLG